jgi:UrcA family protein
MRILIPRNLVAAAFSVVAIAVSICALAGPRPAADPNVEEVSLDLSTWSGARTLYYRLQDAAMFSCDPSGETLVLPWFNRPESGDCYSDKLNALLMKYESSALLSIHDNIRMEPIIME